MNSETYRFTMTELGGAIAVNSNIVNRFKHIAKISKEVYAAHEDEFKELKLDYKQNNYFGDFPMNSDLEDARLTFDGSNAILYWIVYYCGSEWDEHSFACEVDLLRMSDGVLRRYFEIEIENKLKSYREYLIEKAEHEAEIQRQREAEAEKRDRREWRRLKKKYDE